MKEEQFYSIFSEELQDYIGFKRAQGYKYIGNAAHLKALDRFFNLINLTEKELPEEVWKAWSMKRTWETNITCNHRRSEYVGFAQYLKKRRFKVYIPKNYYLRQEKYQAHIYTIEELRSIFKAADSFPKDSRCPYSPLSIPLMLRLLICCGLRAGEVCNLKVKDFDPERKCLAILNAKNGKSRLVPLNDDLFERCKTYMEQVHPDSDPEDWLFLFRKGRQITTDSLYQAFRHVLELAGISHLGRGKGPRLHDFRHSWSNYLFLKWTKEGKDLLNMMPYMAAMMGHQTYKETAYYLALFAAANPVLEEKVKEAFGDIIDNQELVEDKIIASPEADSFDEDFIEEEDEDFY